MREHNSAIAAVREAVSRLGRAVAEAWRFNAEFSERWLAAQRPWEQEGAMRWRGRRLVGSQLPPPDGMRPHHGGDLLPDGSGRR